MLEGVGIMLTAILPEICLLVLAIIILALDLLLKKEQKKNMGWFVFGGLLLTIIISLLFVRMPDEARLIWGDLIRFDQAGFVFRMIFLSGAAITVLFALEDENLNQRGEFYLLLLISTLGLNLMASAADLILLYLAIETASIPLFVLAGFLINQRKSVESGIKYLLFGAMSSTVMLYGFSFLYGFSGTTHLYDIAALILQQGVPSAAVIASMFLILVGFSFKISVFPLHFWAPDVYEGAPTPVAGFLSTASKAAGFAVLIRVLSVVFVEFSGVWTILLAVVASGSMIIGNYLALTQKNLKRLLAYSSIAQAGYILIGVVADSSLGISGTVYYLIAYLVTNIAAFGIICAVGKTVGSDDISAYAGLSRRSPKLALAMLVAILSLAGIPPFAGFIGKLLVFAAAIEANILWLAIVGVLNAVIGLYYYLTVLKVIYLYRSEDETKPIHLHTSWVLAISICVFAILVIGVLIAPWYEWSSAAAMSWLVH